MKKPVLTRATAYDVARLAGVSQSAVSRAFTPGASVSEKMRVKIMQAAEMLEYRPNALARSLSKNQSNIIGVAMGNLVNPYFSATIDELAAQLSHAGLRLLLFHAYYDASMREVMQYRIEALIMLSIPLNEALEAECEANGIPIVVFNRRDPSDTHASVVGDSQAGARSLGALLLAGGHERIAFISAGDQSAASREREDALRQFLSEQGMELSHRESADFSVEQAAASTRKLLLQPNRPDAIFCANDHVALTALQVARTELGIDVGREISIVGFDDAPQSSWPGVGLTTYSQPIPAMVEKTLEAIQCFRSGQVPQKVNIVPGDLKIRTTVRRPVRPIGG